MSVRFSILIATFNREKLLRETIESVMSQSFKDYELIIVDDGSTDSTWDMLQAYGNRILALRQANQGAEVARNLGATRATGEYLAFLDSDDLWLPHALATYDQVIRACGSPALLIGAMKYFRHDFTRWTENNTADVIEAWKYSDYLSKEVGVGLSASNLLIKKSIFDQSGGLRTGTITMSYADVYAAVLRLGTFGPCVIMKRPVTVAYRLHETNIVNNVEAVISAILSVIQGERQGQYPGGRSRRFARYACLGGMSQAWVRIALKARRPGLAFRLLINSVPMLAAGVLKRLWSRLSQEPPQSESSDMSRIADQGDNAAWLEVAETPQWDEFVRHHPHGLVYHLSAWKEVLEASFPHIKGRFLVLRDNESRIVAGLPVYTVQSWLLGNRAVSVPFASVCDPLIGRTEDLTALRSCLSAMLQQTVSRALQIRSMRTTKLIAETDLTATVGYKHHYLPLDRTHDELFMEFSESCVRKKIRKARRNGIVVEARQSDADLRVFYDMLTETRRRLSIPPIPFRFFQSIWKRLGPGNRTLFIGVRDGRPIGCLLVFHFRDIWIAEYCGETASARGVV